VYPNYAGRPDSMPALWRMYASLECSSNVLRVPAVCPALFLTFPALFTKHRYGFRSRCGGVAGVWGMPSTFAGRGQDCAPFQNSFINGPFQVIASGTSGRGQVTVWSYGLMGRR
jgi:hypothetical protein